jgi:hypothetical protein
MTDITDGGPSETQWFCGIHIEGVRYIDQRMMEALHLLFMGQPVGARGSSSRGGSNDDDGSDDDDTEGGSRIAASGGHGLFGYAFHNDTGDLRCELLFSLALARRHAPRQGAALAAPDAHWTSRRARGSRTGTAVLALFVCLGALILGMVLYGPPLGQAMIEWHLFRAFPFLDPLSQGTDPQSPVPATEKIRTEPVREAPLDPQFEEYAHY